MQGTLGVRYVPPTQKVYPHSYACPWCLDPRGEWPERDRSPVCEVCGSRAYHKTRARSWAYHLDFSTLQGCYISHIRHHISANSEKKTVNERELCSILQPQLTYLDAGTSSFDCVVLQS